MDNEMKISKYVSIKCTIVHILLFCLNESFVAVCNLCEYFFLLGIVR